MIHFSRWSRIYFLEYRISEATDLRISWWPGACGMSLGTKTGVAKGCIPHPSTKPVSTVYNLTKGTRVLFQLRALSPSQGWSSCQEQPSWEQKTFSIGYEHPRPCIVASDEVVPAVESIMSECPDLKTKLLVSPRSQNGWLSFQELFQWVSSPASSAVPAITSIPTVSRSLLASKDLAILSVDPDSFP